MARPRRASPGWSRTAAATCCWPQGKKDEAKAAYRKAWAALDPKVDYRRLVEAKLNALGVDPAAAPAEAAK